MSALKKPAVVEKEHEPTAEEVLAKFKTKSGAIRYLDHEYHWPRAKIANFLGLKYQHVRTVLITPLAAEIGRYQPPQVESQA